MWVGTRGDGCRCETERAQGDLLKSGSRPCSGVCAGAVIFVPVVSRRPSAGRSGTTPAFTSASRQVTQNAFMWRKCTEYPRNSAIFAI